MLMDYIENTELYHHLNTVYKQDCKADMFLWRVQHSNQQDIR